MRRGWKIAAILAGLGALEYLLYFHQAAHFFQADTIYWFDHRLTSFSEFIHSFASPDPGGWYRPLTNRTVQSILYPFVGFSPPVYRWVQFLLFFADLVAVFALTWKLTRRLFASTVAALFFAIHTTNAYTTYDLAFVPELAYTFFYICSALAFLHYIQTGGRKLLILSTAAFVLSLCSKESAVTLPLTLLAISYFGGFKHRTIFRSLVPHAVVLTAYLLFTLGYLRIASEALASLHTPPAQFEAGGYYFMAGPHILTNAAMAWSWALNLPVGMLGEWRDQTMVRSIVIWGFAALQMIVLVYTFRTNAWRPISAGFAWFWIAVLPALPLRGHFLPYYLLLPITGFSVMVGASWDYIHKRISSTRPILATAAIATILGLLIVVYSRTSRSEARNNFLLGRSSRIAESSLSDMRRLYPSLPAGAKFFISDEAQPDLNFHHADGGLFRLAYGDNLLQFIYSASSNSPVPPLRNTLIYRNGHLEKLAR